MSISGIGGFNGGAQLLAKPQNRQNLPDNLFKVPSDAPAPGAAATPKTSGDDSVQEFMNYMKKSPAERMLESWLAAHGITKEEFDAMSPKEKQALMDQMKREIEAQIKKQAEEKVAKASSTNILV